MLATEDLFLLKKKSKTEVNALLEDENYLVRMRMMTKMTKVVRTTKPKVTVRCEID